ncbi:MAG: GNAT family protein [Patescibacteria group bacterium]
MKINKPKVLLKDLELQGERINLRPLKLNDVRKIYLTIKNDETILKNTLIPYPVTMKKERKFVENSIKNTKKGTDFVWIIEDRKTKELLGCVGLHKVRWDNKNAEIGYWLNKNFRGQGIMSEAVNLVLKFAFKKLKLHRVWAGVFADNPFSQRVLKKSGFKKEGFLREAHFRWNKWRDDVMYATLDREFKR